MRAKGIPADDILDIVEAMVAAQSVPTHEPIQTARQERNARYYTARKERLKASETVLNRLNSDVSDAERSSSPEQKTPTPLKTHTSPPKEKPPKGGQKKGCELADDWKLDDEYRSEAIRLGLLEEEVYQESDRFRDYWRSKPGSGRLKTDWKATWRNWCRNVVERRSARSPPRPVETRTGNRWIDAANEIIGHDQQANRNSTDDSGTGSHDARTRNADRGFNKSTGSSSCLAAPLLDFERPSSDCRTTWGLGGP